MKKWYLCLEKHTRDLDAHKVPPEETNYSVIAKGAKVTRHTVSKHYKMIQKMPGIKETAPPLLCWIVRQNRI